MTTSGSVDYFFVYLQLELQ